MVQLGYLSVKKIGGIITIARYGIVVQGIRIFSVGRQSANEWI